MVTNLEPSQPYFHVEWVLAYTSLPLSTIEERTGVRFVRELDDLGTVDTAVFRTASGVVAGMNYHEENPEGMTRLYVDSSEPHPRGWKALAEELIRELKLGDAEILPYDD